ncbi:LysR family transcriptional regulator [Chromatiales bacterium (ex Bugula neritina AB1)]|nr:LysR family transcriptional regulator [Chromatiales bacterium (ex Bugula neritina AB1)]
MRFTIKQLEYFVAAGEAGSIKLAAERIAISQPSISSAISHLESELQLQLFVRHHAQGLSLTSSGRRILSEAKLFLRQGEGLYAIASELNNEVRGRLSFGCMITLAPMLAPQLAHSFTSEHPGVTLKTTEGGHEEMLRMLRQVDIDVAISYDLPIQDDMNFEALADLPPYVLVSSQHSLAKRQELSLKDLADEPMILLDLPYSSQYFSSLFESKNLAASVHARSRNQEVVRAMVANGYGYTIANVRPKNLAALDGRKLKAIRLSGRHKPMKIGIMTLNQNRKPLILMAFESHCRRLISGRKIPGMFSDNQLV